MSFRFLEHTADARIECVGRTFAELLEGAASGLYAITLLKRRDEASDERLVRAIGNSREETLIRWLQELNYLLDVEHFVAATFRFAGAVERDVEAVASGYLCAPEERAEEVKSATYQQLTVRETDEGFMAQVTFDL
jgi:SHS2 domain-containing protein